MNMLTAPAEHDGLAVGQLWRDRDKRSLSGRRIVQIVKLEDTFVYYDHPLFPRHTPYRSKRERFLAAFRREVPQHGV